MARKLSKCSLFLQLKMPLAICTSFVFKDISQRFDLENIIAFCSGQRASELIDNSLLPVIDLNMLLSDYI